MAAVDLASSHLSEELAEGDSYEPAASTLGSRYKRATRSRNTLPTNDDSSSDFKVVKLEVKAHSRPTGRSGLLAAQLKGSASQSSVPVTASSEEASSRKRNGKADSAKPSLATVEEDSSASVDSTASAVRLPVPISPPSGNTSPLAVPTKRQNRNNWSLAAAEDNFVPPHLLTSQTLPSDFVFAEDSRPGSVLEGVGRKLRGSDAERFRQSVMRQTGFLEPQSIRRLPAD